MAKKPSVSAADMEAVFGHAVVQPKAKTGEEPAETRAARSLGLTLLDTAHTSPALRTWRARGPDGKTVALVTLMKTTTPAEQARFARAVADLLTRRDALPGCLPVHKVATTRDAFLTDLWTTGSAKDLSALKWPLRRRVEFMTAVARALEKLHGLGLVHGCLCAENVLLDDDLQPVVSEMGLVDIHALTARREAAAYEPYFSPELKGGRDPEPLDDVYAAGRLLQELAGTDDSPPASIGEIIHRCTSPDPSRYRSGRELAAALAAAVETLPVAEDGPAAADPKRGSAEPKRSSKPAPRRPAPVNVAVFRPTTEREPWSPPAWLGISGATLALLAFVGGLAIGGANAAFRSVLEVTLTLGVAAATTLLPGLPRARSVARVVLAAGLGALVVVFDPLSLSFRMNARLAIHGSQGAGRNAVADLLRMGRDFRGVSLAGADLSHLDMTGADLRGVTLSGADLTGASLFGAEVQGATFDGARLLGTDLTKTQLQLSNLGSAACDEETRLPSGFRCSDGHIAH